jgi:hypothetical protein
VASGGRLRSQATTKLLYPRSLSHSQLSSFHGDGCTCGVYAARTLDHLTEINYRDFGIHGEVNLWGKVWQHKLGYRAEFAYPRNFVVPPGFLPANLSILESKVKALTAYGQPVIVEASGRTPS